MRDTLPQGGIVLGGDNGQPAHRLDWEEAIGEEEARDLLWAPYPGQSRYLLFAPSFYHRVTVPKPEDLRRCVRSEDDAAAALSDMYFRRALDVSKPGVSMRGVAIEGEAKKMRFPPYFDCTFTVSKAGVSVRLSAARQGEHDRPLQLRCPGPDLGGSAAPGSIDRPYRCGSYTRCTTCRIKYLEGEPEKVTKTELSRCSKAGTSSTRYASR